ncbi:MAG: SMI1/KNR4 family protein [Clostridia bacterium]|nr:SMI1/KNR4 family protein [Clostridia bacterium]
MSKDIIEVVESLEDLEQVGPATLEEIEKAQEILGVKFADDFIQLLSKYKVLYAKNIEWMGLHEAEYVNLVKNTLHEKEVDKTAPADMYFIEDLGIDGLQTWQHESGAVYGRTRFYDDLEKLADSLVEYIEKYYDDDDEI